MFHNSFMIFYICLNNSSLDSALESTMALVREFPHVTCYDLTFETENESFSTHFLDVLHFLDVFR